MHKEPSEQTQKDQKLRRKKRTDLLQKKNVDVAAANVVTRKLWEKLRREQTKLWETQ